MDESSVVMAADGSISDNRERRHQAECRLGVWTGQIRTRVNAAIKRQELAALD